MVSRKNIVVFFLLSLPILLNLFSISLGEEEILGVTSRTCDSPNNAPPPSQNVNNLQEKLSIQPEQTTSGYEEDEIFGTYEEYNLDQYLYREEGPIRFPINITRVFSRDKTDYDELIIGQPQLVLRVWDVDAKCGPVCDGCCEVDNVYINGNFIGTLDGANESWSTVRFDIPIEWFQDGKIKDATYNDPGVAPTPGENWIEIDINTTPCYIDGDSCWAVQTDYGEIQVKGMRPAALIHGLNVNLVGGGSPSSWNTFRTYIPGNVSEAYQLNGNGSVANNARIIENFIDQTLSGFGVKEINIIGHSKGGLDSTETIIGRGHIIENIITLGSPLLGTEYADHFYNNHQLILIFEDEIAINDLRIVTRERYYQTRTSPEPGVSYYHFAGNRFGADETECPLPFDNTILFNVENDELVPVNRTFPGWRTSADKIRPYQHSEILSREDVGEWAVQIMKDSVERSIAVSSVHHYRKIYSSQAVSTGPQHTFAIHDSLNSGDTKTYQIPIDSSVSSSAFFITYQATADFDMVLIDPNGARIDMPDFKGSFIPNGNLAGVFYNISSPMPGLWLIEVHANTDGEIKGGAELSTDLILNVTTDKDSYASGEPISLIATLMRSGIPFTGANVVAYLTTLSGFSDNVTLSDNGDGTYSTTYTPPTGGYFIIKVDAENLAGEKFQREAHVFITVSPPTATTVGVISESANDTNGNGLYDNLTLEINVQVNTEGDYTVIGRLEDSIETLIANASSSPHLLPGSQNVSLVFDGRTIRNSGRNGPYNLAQITIHDLNQQGLIADTKTNIYSTAPYNFYDFEGPILGFGSGHDYGTDSDGDGFYNTLTIELEILVNPGYAGSYTYNAELQDLNGTGIEWYSNPFQFLDVGLNVIQLIYSGAAIATSGLDGPYRVGNFHLYDLDNQDIQLSSSNAYTTAEYQVCQFQGCYNVQLKKGVLLKKKNSGGKDEVTLILKSCSNMSDVISELANSSVYISVSTADGKSTLYSKEISGSEFKPNGNKTKYTYKEKAPEKHKDTLFPVKDKINCKIKKVTIGEITNSEEGATEDIKVRITVGSKTYEAVNTWTVKDSSKKTKLIFKQ